MFVGDGVARHTTISFYFHIRGEVVSWEVGARGGGTKSGVGGAGVWIKQYKT